MAQVLGIVAKQPIAGHVKTRLAASTSAEFASSVAEIMLKVTLDTFADLADHRFLVFAPPAGEPYFRELASGRYELSPQGEGDLGERMTRYFAEQVVSPAARVVLIGADSPTLPGGYVHQAFDWLSEHDVVLGPALDGGYYLVGCARSVPPIFGGIEWGGPNVLRDTVRSLPAELRLALLPPWYDVDTLDDCQMVHGHLAAQSRAGLPLTDELRHLMNFLAQSQWLADEH